MERLTRVQASFSLETAHEWRKWIDLIPFINWPEEWEVKAIPPFGGAIVRYQVRLKGDDEHVASIYLDCYDELGYYGKPYWEVCPVGEDVGRCDMADIKRLFELIETSLNERG